MPIAITCTCGKKLSVPDEAVGHNVRCPHCNVVRFVPLGVGQAEDALSGYRPRPEPGPPATRPFAVEVPYAFAYPLKRHGLGFLGAVAAIYAVGAFLGAGLLWVLSIVVGVLLSFFLSAYFLSIVRNSAGGDPDPPNIPDFTDLWDDIVRPLFLMLAALIAAAAPLILYHVLTSRENVQPSPVVEALLGVWAAIYYPMAVMAVAVSGSFAGVSPHIVLPAIFRIPVQHLIMAAAVWCIWQGYEAVHRCLGGLFSQADYARAAGQVVLYVLSIYASWVVGRIIGITHWIYRERIGWFNRS